MEYSELIKIILSGCKFMYYSYDHKKALAEYKDQYITDYKILPNPNCWDMPKELKEKYKIEKIGRLRQIDFAPNGQAWRFKIGCKYSKTFYVEDFGVNIFPLNSNE